MSEFPLATDNGKRYREEEIDGERFRTYESGVIQQYDADSQKWMFAPGTARHHITEENARSLADRRWELYREAAMQGIMDESGAKLDTEAVRWLTRVAAKHSAEGGSGGAAYMKQAREMAGIVAPASDAVSVRSPDGYTVRAESREAMRELVDMLRQARNED